MTARECAIEVMTIYKTRRMNVEGDPHQSLVSDLRKWDQQVEKIVKSCMWGDYWSLGFVLRPKYM